MLGHQVLLAFGDSSSRVLPIVEEEDSYKIQFEGEFGFQPESLVEVIRKTVLESEIAANYIVEVGDCESQKIVYSFKVVEEKQSNLIPCKGREMPKACYFLLFSRIDAAGNLQLVQQEEKSEIQEEKESQSLYYGLMLFLLALLFVLYFLWKRKKVAQIDPMVIKLGKYDFDMRKEELILAEQRIELTSKEAELLKLLYETANSTVEREHILNRVWGDEGDYVGRTLDVFISKLRKKLEFDSEIKIVNVRGVGYKLVL